MSCTRVLHAIGSRPQPAAMPVDLAMCLSLSQRQPLYQLLSMAPLQPTLPRYQPTDTPQSSSSQSPQRPSSPSSPSSSSSSSSSSSASSSLSPETRSCLRRDSGGASKKRVVFADAKGLALTAVRVFIPDASYPTSTLVMKPSVLKLQGQQSAPNKAPRHKMRLGFPQPTLDIKGFLARMREVRVQLESCSLSENSLIGRVRVFHSSIEKAVLIRVTFDSWRSHRDVPCRFLQRCPISDMDVFTFDLSIPQNVDPNERVEFFVSLRAGPGATMYCDNNRGQNYRVHIDKDTTDFTTNHFYPTLSKHRSPSWPSKLSLGTQSHADLQNLQKLIKQSRSGMETPVFS